MEYIPHFSIGNTDFFATNIVRERFQRIVPKHAHGHNCYEIHYISSGCGTARIDGVIYTLRPGMLYVTGAYVEHEQWPLPQDPMDEFCIYLKLSQRGCSNTAHEAALLTLFEKYPFWLGEECQEIGMVIERIFEERDTAQLGYEIQIEALLRQMVVMLTRRYERGSRDVALKGNAISDNASIIIEEYFLYQYQNLSLEELASKLNLSSRQTERLLKQYYGKTFLQKKTEARMAMAVVLLTDSRKTITAISDSLGYSSTEHFSAAFKKYYGMTPKQYRKNREVL